MNNLLLFPILIPMLTAALSLVAWKSHRLQRLFGVVGAFGLFGAAGLLFRSVYTNGIQVAYVGGWEAPYGITLVADLLSAIMVMLAGIVAVAAALYAMREADPEREKFGLYPLMHVLLMGVCGAFLTGDLFNLYVWFEVMLMSSFVLLSMGGERPQLEGAMKYVTLNLFSSAIFLAALGILYGAVGTVNMADAALKMDTFVESELDTTLAVLFLVAFGIKAALFPLFFWLPASYHTAPGVVAAVFAGLLSKVGVYALTRVFTLIFVQEDTTQFIQPILLVLAGLTMIAGILGALAQSEIRRILSFLIISGVGFMIMGLGLFTTFALAGMILYLMHDVVVKTNLFLIAGMVHRLRSTYALAKLGGLYRQYPFLAALFFVSGVALGGAPPLSGFFPKFALLREGLAAEQYLLVGTAIVVSLLTLYSVMRIWTEAFWKPAPDGVDTTRYRDVGASAIPLAGLALLLVGIGLGAEFFFGLSLQAAEQLMDRDTYLTTVLGEAYLESASGAAP
jgi:multicomponent Na+:H+ antiporter subunit D